MAVLMSQTAKLREQTAQTTVTRTMVGWAAWAPAPCSLSPGGPWTELTILPLQMKALRGKLQRVLRVLRLWRKVPEQ